jgi:hypothetical protein
MNDTLDYWTEISLLKKYSMAYLAKEQLPEDYWVGHLVL